MAPRNNDASTSYKKKNFSVEDGDDIKNVVASLVHKKHKVVKLIKSQIQKIQEEGLICATAETELDEDEIMAQDIYKRSKREQRGRPSSVSGAPRLRAEDDFEEIEIEERDSNTKNVCFCFILLIFLLLLFFLIFLIVWISSGPLSNSIAHSPMPAGSFIRTDACSSLEKKYLLRWSKPEFFE